MLVNLLAVLAVRGKHQRDLAFDLRKPECLISEIVRERRLASPELRREIAKLLDADEKFLFKRPGRIPPFTPLATAKPTGSDVPAEVANVAG